MAERGDIRQWLDLLELGRYAQAFEANDVDLRAVAYLSDDDLKELGVSLGHRRVILAAIAKLPKEEVTAPPAEPLSRAPRERPQEADAERRQLTVLFCDLVGSTELSRRFDPEDMREVLRVYQNAVTSAVVRYEGYVARFLGDGVLAYFGWPRAYEDQAERAVRGGLDAVAAVHEIVVGEGETLKARVGIATGQVVVGDLIGDIASDEQTVVGQTPNLAARLQGVAESGQVVISASTRDLLGTVFELDDLGPHSLKGFPDPVPAWRVTGERAAESRFEATYGDVQTRLVGREHELGLLRERWELAKSGEGQVVLLSGEAGIGKSRLLQDFKRRVGEGPLVNLYYQCSPHHTNSAFHPVIQRLRRAAAITREDAAAAQLNKLEDLLSKTARDVAAVMPLFAALLSIPAEDRFGPLDLTPQQFRHRVIEAMIEQIGALSRARPVLFVMEDAHWVDPSMSDYVAEIMPRIVDQPVFMLITYRPEFAPSWAAQSHHTRVTLNKLGRKQAAEIAHAVGGRKLVDAIIERIVVRADGVPLYVEELTKSVVESYLSKDDRAAEAAIPASLQSSLVARLDRLDDAKEIAQVGAVIGREFSHLLLAALLNRSEEDLEAALERLVASGLVFRRGIPPGAIYTFKHALVQDAAYDTILISRRRKLHALIVEILESRIDSPLSERIDLLAHHAYQGQVWDKALLYLELAGNRAMDRAAVREAVALYEQALLAGAHLPQTREALAKGIDLRFQLRNALWSIGAFERILPHLRDAEQMAGKLNGPRRIGWASVYRSASLWQLGRTADARTAAERALAINEGPNDLSLQIGATFYLACATVTSGDCRRAEALFQSVVDPLVGDLSRDRCGLPFVPAVVARSWLVWALAERGEFEEGLAHADVALAIAEEVGHPFNLAHIYYDLGYLYAVRGDFDRAVATLEQASAIIREWNLSYLSPFITGFLGHACALAGNTERGIALLEQALSEYESIGMGLFRSLVGIQLGEALLLDGRAEAAAKATERGLALARRRSELGHQTYGLRVLGEVALHPDIAEPDAAREHFETALGVAELSGMRPLVAHCHSGLARLHGQAGRAGESTEHATQADAIYTELDMRAWPLRAAGE